MICHFPFKLFHDILLPSNLIPHPFKQQLYLIEIEKLKYSFDIPLSIIAVNNSLSLLIQYLLIKLRKRCLIIINFVNFLHIDDLTGADN